MRKGIFIILIIVILGIAFYIGYQKSLPKKQNNTGLTAINPPDRSQPHGFDIELAYLKEQSKIPANIDTALVIRLMPEAINNFETALHGINSQDTISKADWAAAKEIALKIHNTGTLPPGAYLQVITFRSSPRGPRLDLVFPTEKNNDPGFILPLIEIGTMKAYIFK